MITLLQLVLTALIVLTGLGFIIWVLIKNERDIARAKDLGNFLDKKGLK